MTSTPVGVNAVTDDRALSFRGVDHVSLTVSNLNASEQFYTEVLGFMVVLDLGYGLVCMDKATGFTLGLIKHEDGTGGRFSHLSTGLDHLGLTAQTREELVAWEQKFRRLGVTFTPIRDEPLGYHLNFRDPDDIALELSAPTEVYAEVLLQLRSRTFSDEEIRQVAVLLGLGDYVAGPSRRSTGGSA